MKRLLIVSLAVAVTVFLSMAPPSERLFAQPDPANITVDQFFLPGTSTVGYRVHASSAEMHMTLGQGDIRASGGYKVAYTYSHSDALVTGVTSGNMPVAGTVVASQSGTGVLRQGMPWAGSVRGIFIGARSALTANAAHAAATVNGTRIGLAAVIGAGLTQTQYATAAQAIDLDRFVVGDQVGCQLTTDAEIAPANLSNEIVCSVIIEY